MKAVKTMTISSGKIDIYCLDRELLFANSEDIAAFFGELVYDAYPEFYSLIPLPKTVVALYLAELIGQRGGELEYTYSLRMDGRDRGIISILPAREVKSAMTRGALAIMRKLYHPHIEKFAAHLQNFRLGIEPLHATGNYIARLSVAASARRMGIGMAAVKWAIARNANENLTVHAHRDNAPVIDLYRKLGFEFISKENFLMRAMIHGSQIQPNS